MNTSELKELLAEMAEKDLSDGADIDDHPCSCAIRAIDELEDRNKNLVDAVNGKVKLTNKKWKMILAGFNEVIV